MYHPRYRLPSFYAPCLHSKISVYIALKTASFPETISPTQHFNGDLFVNFVNRLTI